MRREKQCRVWIMRGYARPFAYDMTLGVMVSHQLWLPARSCIERGSSQSKLQHKSGRSQKASSLAFSSWCQRGSWFFLKSVATWGWPILRQMAPPSCIYRKHWLDYFFKKKRGRWGDKVEEGCVGVGIEFQRKLEGSNGGRYESTLYN